MPYCEDCGEENDEVADELAPEAEPPHQHLGHIQVPHVRLDPILQQVKYFYILRVGYIICNTFMILVIIIILIAI